MKVFLSLAFVAVIGGAVFALQNATASPVMMRFLLWRFETSLAYSILGSIVLGMLIILLFWIPRAVRGSLSMRSLRRENQELKRELIGFKTEGGDRSSAPSRTNRESRPAPSG